VHVFIYVEFVVFFVVHRGWWTGGDLLRVLTRRSRRLDICGSEA